jgi:LacI family gluconate utilization system Gnt-I transcriptional repressor
VRAAVERLAYVPNLVAGGLASSRSRLIAVVVPSISQSIFSTTIQAMADGLFAAGYSVILGLGGAADERMDEALMAVLARRPDGVILTGTVTAPASRAALVSAAVPVIETWDLPADPIDMVVGFSHEAVGRAVAAHVVASGRRRPLIVSAAGRRARARTDGFVAAFREQGLGAPPVAVFEGGTTFGQGRRALAAHLDAGGRPDVVVCTSDWSAHGVLVEAAARGLRRPQDLAVIGFGDLDFAVDTEPALTTVRIDGAAIARRAVGFLLQRAAGEAQGPLVADVGFELVVRSSG